MKQFSLFTVFAESIRLVKNHWKSFFIFGIIASIIGYVFPSLIFDGKLFSDTLVPSDTDITWAGGIVLGVLLVLYFAITVIWLKVTLNIFDKKQWSSNMFFSRRDWMRLVALLGIFIIVFGVLGFGAVSGILLLGMGSVVADLAGLLLCALCIIVAVYFLAKYYFAIQYIIDKRTGVIESFLRSSRTTHNYMMRITLLIASILFFSVVSEMIAIGFSLTTYSVGVVVGTMLDIVIVSVIVAVDAIAYRTLDR